jgi:hypothetical protein
MRRNWKYGLMCAVAGLCCFATVAEVDAGIIFRRRGTAVTSVTPATTTSATTTVRRRGILGRRRGTVTNTQVTTMAPPAVTVRGQTP